MPMNRAVLILLSVAACSAASALTIEYGPGRPEALAECDRAEYTGQRAAADTCYRRLLAENEDPRIKAEAARSIGDARSANTHFQTALESFPEDAAVRVRWGQLFLDTHQANEAVQLFLESLELDPDNIAAKLGLASVSAGRFEDKAREWVGEVLDADPENV